MSAFSVDHKIRPRPRPILKSLPEYSPLPFSTYPLHSPHVHFPPTPSLTSTDFTHSAIVYDRAPIVVSENVCALPERGGRCYESSDAQPRKQRSHSHSGVLGGTSFARGSQSEGSYFHPRAFEAVEPEQIPTHNDCYDSYFSLYDNSSSSSASSSSSDSDSDSSYDSFNSCLPSIPRVVNSSPGDSRSAYPPDLSLISQNGTQSVSLPHAPQQHHFVQYTCAANIPGSKLKKTTSGRRVKSQPSSRSSNTAAQLAKFGGGFSDQTHLLDGCLGGF